MHTLADSHHTPSQFHTLACWAPHIILVEDYYWMPAQLECKSLSEAALWGQLMLHALYSCWSSGECSTMMRRSCRLCVQGHDIKTINCWSGGSQTLQNRPLTCYTTYNANLLWACGLVAHICLNLWFQCPDTARGSWHALMAVCTYHT